MATDLGLLIPEFEPYARELVTLAGQAGLQPRVTSTLRSYSEQKRLYTRFLAGLSQFPAAPPGRSAHEYGYAFDMVVTPFDALADVGGAWLEAGGIWHASDAVHFEFPGFVVPQGFAQSTAGTAVRTVADWFAQLPWIVTLPLPTYWITSSRKITYQRLRELAAGVGFDLPAGVP